MENRDFQKYDNIDREVVEISRGSLLLHLKNCAEYATIPSEARSYAGLALTLLASAFLTDHFYNIWGIPGETIRSTFLVGGIASAVWAGNRLRKWYQTKEKYTPEEIIKTLTLPQKTPVALLSAPSAPIEYVPKNSKIAITTKKLTRDTQNRSAIKLD